MQKPEIGVESVKCYPTREHVRPKYLDYATGEELDHAIDDFANSTVDYCYTARNVPQSYECAISSPESGKWKVAMDEELNSLWDNDAFQLTSLPEGRTSVGGKWVYTIKLGPNREEKYKARFLAKGYSQAPGIDYHEIFSNCPFNFGSNVNATNCSKRYGYPSDGC